MKKLLILALLVAAGSVFNTASAQSKKKGNQNAKWTVVECNDGAVVLTSPSDTLIYAAGMSMTRGLDEYLADYPSGKALITSLECAEAAIKGETGTTITVD